MVAVFIPVVLVVVQGEAGFLLHAERRGQLQIPALVLVAARLANANQAAAAMDKALDGSGNIRILPDLAAGVGGVAVAHVDKYIDAVQRLWVCLDVVKADKLHVERRTGQRFNHARIAVILLLVQRMVDHVAAPGALLPPAVQHSHGLDAVGRGTLDVFVQFTELVADALDIVEEFRELAGQLEVAAVADAVNGLAQDGAACGDPVLLGFAHRVTTLVEGIGEEVGQEAPLGVLDAGNVGNQAQGAAVADTADNGVHAGLLKFRHERLTADPVVAQKHHSLFAVGVDDVGHFLHQTGNLTALERLEILVLLARHAVLVVVVALVDDELGAELIADLFLKLFQNVGRNGGRIAVPVHILLAAQLVKDQRKQVEEGGEADDVDIRMALQILTQAFHRVSVGLGLAYIERNLMFDILPVVDDRVVHVDGVPDQVGQKADRVLVVGGGGVDNNALGSGIIAPVGGGDRLARRAVNDLPPAGNIIVVVDLHQLTADAGHQGDGQRAVLGGVERGHNVALLRFIGVRLRPGVVLAGGVIGGVDLGSGVLQLLRELGAVAVADGIRAPAFEQVESFRNSVHISGDCYTTVCIHFLLSSVHW